MTDTGKTVLITGASRGIGRALALHYAGRGDRVIAVARGFDQPMGDNVETIEVDLAGPEGPARVIAAMREKGPSIDIVVNNAAQQRSIDLKKSGDTAFAANVEREIGLNLTTPIVLSHGLLPFVNRPGGTIANVTSLVSVHPKPSAPVYSASKAGLASFTASLRRQVEAMGIRVVEVVPPLVATDMTAGRGRGKLTPEAMARAIVQGIDRGETRVAPGLSRKVLALNRFLPELTARLLAGA